jgi:DNA-binding beta-propeller fold protein YncE
MACPRHLIALAVLFATYLSAPAADDNEAPYRLERGFFKLPEGLSLGAVSGVATHASGNVLVFHRGPRPVLVFDAAGNFVRSFGDGLFDSAHGLRVDPDGNVWATDNANHTVVKFDRAGKVLLTIGERGVAGEDERHFDKPTDVAFAANGDFYVSDGYGNSRVVKFDRNGNFLLAWGKKGAGEGEFDLPHAVRTDSNGRVYVADRENNRIQVFDSDGKFLRQLAAGVAPFGLFITPDDSIFVADGRAHRVVKLDKDGKSLASWGGGGREPGRFLLPHGICVAPEGAVYIAEITGARVQKFLPK